MSFCSIVLVVASTFVSPDRGRAGKILFFQAFVSGQRSTDEPALASMGRRLIFRLIPPKPLRLFNSGLRDEQQSNRTGPVARFAIAIRSRVLLELSSFSVRLASGRGTRSLANRLSTELPRARRRWSTRADPACRSFIHPKRDLSSARCVGHVHTGDSESRLSRRTGSPVRPERPNNITRRSYF